MGRLRAAQDEVDGSDRAQVVEPDLDFPVVHALGRLRDTEADRVRQARPVVRSGGSPPATVEHADR